MSQQNRRDFMKTSAATALAAGSMPYWFSPQPVEANFKSALERPVMGCIGTGSRWDDVGGRRAVKFADIVAVCDVDKRHLEKAKNKVKAELGKAPEAFEDYRKILDNKDIEVVTIVTTDHWHTKIAIEAMKAGKDVYCEKPLTLTIEEGKMINKVQKETGRVFQVGTQQRSEMGLRFLRAIAMIRDGRIGDVHTVTCNIGQAPVSPSIPAVAAPSDLNWEMWLGQAPLVDYRYMELTNSSGKIQPQTRGHYEFRWWYEYSGGKMTDWGAHHVDIASWACGLTETGPQTITPIMAEHPVEFKDGMPLQDDMYNVATKFDVQLKFENGITMNIVSDSDDGNGILFEGTEGRFHVSRGSMKGKPAEDLETNPITDDQIAEVYGGKMPEGGSFAHMNNFLECVKTGEQPISDVHTHHRALTNCHLANIAIRLNRELKWDPTTEQIIGDSMAQEMQGREQRKGYEIEA
ncbi:Inositol 2-dehydrogenase [Polystyrenella longa]|uniref:Inositol 2-dehydrogenase n=1 Tax=Polystyrenella longa TaxID=2528007 RepID=A0A518CSB2_9PLAN|nr:Gfo/Idh/MocA family oxidoreductase [Polystyrenella longa]QDU82117.1 Inositol 2-dehydrogenase [Polystyrenella longa]